ncbi:hypothetical protein ACIBJI_39915 [Nocardia sp. NPDC050408]|uniref:hypothetical protein n=1 Tax=Nocardia sp. NPDC050408 TaxID=3364319 RepID=UPI00379AF2EC
MSEAPSFDERFGGLIAELKRLDHRPAVKEVEQLQHHFEQLDHELTISAVTDERRYELSKLSRQAHALVTDARDRAERALDIAEAAHERQVHDALHPTITSPQLDSVPELEWDLFDR